jgi:hypothetical protein
MAHNGYIKRLVGDRGFGFVNGPDGSEYFFHSIDRRRRWVRPVA